MIFSIPFLGSPEGLVVICFVCLFPLSKYMDCSWDILPLPPLPDCGSMSFRPPPPQAKRHGTGPKWAQNR